MHSPQRSAEELFSAYWRAEQERDVEQILACWQPDGAFVDRLGRVTAGHDALRDFYRASAAAFPRAAVEQRRVIAQGAHAAAQYVARLGPADGPDRHIRVAVVAQLADGRFARLESYFDGTALAG